MFCPSDILYFMELAYNPRYVNRILLLLYACELNALTQVVGTHWTENVGYCDL